MQPHDDGADARALDRVLASVARRRLIAQCLYAAAITAVATITATFVPAISRHPVLARAIGAAIAAAAGVGWLVWTRTSRSRAASALAIERVTPASRNVVATACELLDEPERASWWMRARVFRDAAAAVDGLTPAHVVPLGRAIAAFCLALAVPLMVTAVVPHGIRMRPSPGGAEGAAARIPSDVEVTIRLTPPEYIRQPSRSIENPVRFEAIEGTRAHIVLRRARDGWRLRFDTDPLPLARSDDGVAAEITLTESGYLAIEQPGASEDRRLIPVTVTSDRAPAIAIEAPAKDLLLPDASGSIPLTASATDDFGLTTLDVRYTRVSGSGEQFSFVEGSLPLEIDRATGQHWSGRGVFALSRLGLQPGDAVIYRAVAKDGRPGESGTAASDTYVIEIAGPGQVALPGFELPPDRERYALSQQMIVLKIQRLRARERALALSARAEEAAAIGAEQRAVRANFIFLMGGEVEDEEQEAQQSHEIQEGRLENTARREMTAAVRFMSRAEQALAAVATADALSAAKAAADALQRAFGRNRYVLRMLPARSRVDPSRRLSGDLKEATAWRRDPGAAPDSREVAAAHALLSGVLTAAGGSADAGDAPLSALAERALAVKPTSAEWQEIAAAILRATQSTPRESAASDRRRALQEAANRLLKLIRREAIRPGRTAPLDPLRGEIVEGPGR